ncbi:MAG: hypothetical protein ACMG6S_30070 [Byssovorax sp.]
MIDKGAARAIANKLTRSWLAAVDRAEEYTPVRDLAELPPQALASSGFWCASLFPACADPYEPDVSSRVSVHLAKAGTLDLLKHDYVVNDIPVTLIESRSFALVRVARENADVLALAEAKRGEEISRIAAAVFGGTDQQPAPSFKLPKTIKEGSTFSTNPWANPLLIATWRDRIDGGIHHECLYFLCYKRVSQIVGFWNEREWFDEEFRAKHPSYPV